MKKSRTTTTTPRGARRPRGFRPLASRAESRAFAREERPRGDGHRVREWIVCEERIGESTKGKKWAFSGRGNLPMAGEHFEDSARTIDRLFRVSSCFAVRTSSALPLV